MKSQAIETPAACGDSEACETVMTWGTASADSRRRGQAGSLSGYRVALVSVTDAGRHLSRRNLAPIV
jgi:hypothetical protein